MKKSLTVFTSTIFFLSFVFALSFPAITFAVTTIGAPPTPPATTPFGATPIGVPTGGNSGPAGVPTGGNSGPATPKGAVTIVNPLKVKTLEGLLVIIMKAVVQIGTIILTLAIIWVGFLFVKAQGNPEAVSSARSALLWTVIGGLILLGAQAISLVIASTVRGL